jgi:phosphoribosylformimino-5-aminoimidazole carboxamide ribotide isomerase
MEIIPVIDLMHGQVVHARFGLRQHYQPIQSSLCDSSEPIAVVGALLELYPFDRLYIADLAAIQGENNHFQTILAIQDSFPQLEIWLDSGIDGVDKLKDLKRLSVSHVIGSENIKSIDAIIDLKQALGEAFILSLDFNAQGFLGPRELLEKPQYWPQQVIAMTLYKVGSHAGVDNKLLTSLLNKKTSQKIYAAGGVRNLDDLKQINEIGITGALIASALHNQQLSSKEIRYANQTL